MAANKSDKVKAKDKPKAKTNAKDVQLLVRIDTQTRDRFSAACKELDTTASREVRRFIKKFLVRYEKGELDD